MSSSGFQRARQDSNLQPSDSKSVGQKSQASQEQRLTDTPKERLQTSLQTNPESAANQGESQVLELPAELAVIIESWSTLTEHVRQAIVTLVTSVTVTAREGDEVV